jgi:hypothetical protein
MKPTQNFLEWYEGQFDLSREEIESLRNTADALLKNPHVLRLLTQLEANAMKYLSEADPANPQDMSTRVIMVQAVRALPKVLNALTEDKAFDKALNR